MTKEAVRILLIEDNPGDARLIQEFLSGPAYFGVTYRLSHVGTLSGAIQTGSSNPFDIILLDLNLSDSVGLETLESLTSCAAIPIH